MFLLKLHYVAYILRKGLIVATVQFDVIIICTVMYYRLCLLLQQDKLFL